MPACMGWVREIAALTQPDRIVWCDGSAAPNTTGSARDGRRRHADASSIRRSGPDSYLACSDPSDVARVEDRTFICSEQQGRRRPDQQLGRARGNAAHAATACSTAACAGARCTSCRFRWGRSAARSRTSASSLPTAPTSSSTCGCMTRMGRAVFDVLGSDGAFVPCVHSVGAPLAAGAARRRVALQQGPEVHRRISPRRARSGATARATAAMRCSARSASRCASPR